MADYIRVEGVLYNCRVRYTMPDGLDRLSDFVLETAIKTHGVRDIRTLVGGFGLPPRLMQDVLADLLRRGYATLDLTRHELRPVLMPVVRPEARDDKQRVLSVWQDPVTGRFLPGDMLERYATPPPPGSGVTTLRPRPTPHPPPDFIDAPSTRVIASLNMVDPSFLASRRDPDEVVDSIIDRERSGPRDVYVPVDRAAFTTAAEKPVEFVVAWGLPNWISRAWSLALARAAGAREADAVELALAVRPALAAAAVQDTSDVPTSPFDQACFLAYYTRWFKAFRIACDTAPSSDRDGDGDEEDDDPALLDEQNARRALVGRLRAARGVGVRFGPPAAATHLDTLWADTRSYLLVNARPWDAAGVARVVGVIERSTRERRTPFVIFPRDENEASPDGRELAEVLAPALYGPIAPAFTLRDGTEVVVAGPGLLASDRPALAVTGWSPGAELGELIRNEEGGWLASDLLKEGAPADETPAEPAAADPSDEPIRKLIDNLNELGRDFAEARRDALAAADAIRARNAEEAQRRRDAEHREARAEQPPDPDAPPPPDAADSEPAADADVDASAEIDTDTPAEPEPAPPMEDDRVTPAAARPDFNLARRADELREAIDRLDRAPGDGGLTRPLLVPLQGRSYFDLVIEAFDLCAPGDGPRPSLEFHLGDGDAAFWEKPSAVELLRGALRAGASVLLAVCPDRPGASPSDDAAAVAVLRSLRTRLGVEGLTGAFRVARCDAPLPPGFILEAGGPDGTRHVAVGSLAVSAGPDPDGAVGFLVQSPPLAAALRQTRDESLVELTEADDSDP